MYDYLSAIQYYLTKRIFENVMQILTLTSYLD